MIDLLPPHDEGIEEIILGGIMLDCTAIEVATELNLTPSTFYNQANQLIFAAILRLFGSEKAIDILTVTSELRKTKDLDKVGGAFYVTKLTNRVGSTAGINTHILIIKEMEMSRNMLSLSYSMQRSVANKEDVFKLMTTLQDELFEISNHGGIKSEVNFQQALVMTMAELKARSESSGMVNGISSGIYSLDEKTGGFLPGELIILAARPAMGKTAFALKLIRESAIHYNVPSVIFSLEMGVTSIVNRIISSESGIPASVIKSGDLLEDEWACLHNSIAKIEQAPLFIDDTAAIDVSVIRSKCMKLKRKHNIGLVLIDYLQLVTTSKKLGNREQEVAYISRSLKALAKEIGVPVIALSQLSRAVESRGGDKRPQLSDLRGSGGIEQDADKVMFLYRPEYYGFDTNENGDSLIGVTELIIAKQRDGETGTVKMNFQSKIIDFIDFEMPEFIEVGASNDFSPLPRIQIQNSAIGEDYFDVPT